MLNNPWIIGIATGIIVWLVTFMASRMLLSKRENREYAQKVNSANREVIIAIRPGIAEGSVPNSEIVEAMIQSTARRYGVTASDLYNARQISEELIKEVMDSSFLSSAQKSEYCGKLVPVRATSQVIAQEEVAERKSGSTSAAHYRDRMISMMSAMMSMSAAIMTVFLAIPVLQRRITGVTDSFDFLGKITIFLPAAITLSLIVLQFVYREFRSYKNIESTVVESTKTLEGLSVKIRESLKKDK